MADESPKRAYKVRFRNTACPVTASTPKEFSKYDYFFDRKQRWVSPAIDLVNFVDEAEDVKLVYKEPEGIASPTGTDSAAEVVAPEKPIGPVVVPLDNLSPAAAQFAALAAHDVGPTPTSFDRLDERLTSKREEPHLFSLDGASQSFSLIESSDVRSKTTPPEPDLWQRLRPPGWEEAGVVRRQAWRPTFHERLQHPCMGVSSPDQQIPTWPFKSNEQAYLFRHFIENLSPWCNVTDSQRHFTTIVPRMATTSPMLMYAICAVSARHLGRVSGLHQIEYMVYHEKCIQNLLPILNDDARIFDDDLVATTLLLRLYEELDVPSASNDEQRHMFGTPIFLRASKSSSVAQANPFREALFWTYLRQEIAAAFVKQRDIHADLDGRILQAKFGAVEEISWSNRIMLLCAQVLRWAFGKHPTLDGWHELHDAIHQWEEDRSETYEAIFYQPEDPSIGRWFPDIWFADDEHVVSSVHFHLAKLVLAVHDPAIPRLGSRAKKGAEMVKEQVLKCVRTIVGTGLSNKWAPARHWGSVVLVECYQWFTIRAEQEELIGFLDNAEKTSGWPTSASKKTLIEEWGWYEK